MFLVDIAIKRPVTIAMFTVAAIIFGMVSLSRLQLNLLPDISYPTLTIRTLSTGSAPSEIETLLTRPVEESLGVIKHVRKIRSRSQTGQSDVTLEFDWGTNMDFAVLDVREKLDALELPRDVRRPLVMRFDPSSEPVYIIGLLYKKEKQLDGISALKQLRRYAEQQVQKKLESQTGVAAVKINGGLEDEIQVLIDQARLDQLNLNIDTLIARIGSENVNLSGGRVEEATLKYLVRTLNQFTSIQDIENIILAQKDGSDIYLRDVAQVIAGYREQESIIRINGDEAVEIAIYKEGDVNVVAVAEDIRKQLENIKKFLPGEYQLVKLYDESVFITQSISNVAQAAILGGLLAILVLYLFLGNAWATAIISIAIPVSVITSFNMMYASHVSLNIMSLGGIALAIGLLVDNSIVVLENISRHASMGKDIVTATADGAGEVGTAVTASTLTTVAVFFPMVFVQGVAGELFSDQALVITFSLLVSLVISLTLIPVMSATKAGKSLHETADDHPRQVKSYAGKNRLLKLFSRISGGAGKFFFYSAPVTMLKAARFIASLVSRAGGKTLMPLSRKVNSMYEVLLKKYETGIVWAIANRVRTLLTALFLFIVSLLLLPFIGIELIPSLEQDEFSVEYSFSPGTSINRTDELISKTQTMLKSSPHVEHSYSIAGDSGRMDANSESSGENTGTLTVVLKGSSAENHSIRQLLRKHLDQVPGLEYRIVNPALFTFRTPLEVEISGFDLDKLRLYNAKIIDILKQDDQFSEIESSVTEGNPEIQIIFDQKRLSALGLQESEIASRIVKMLKGFVATRYRLPEREIDILVRTDESARSTVTDIRRLIINPESSQPVSLSAVAEIRTVTGPAEIVRVNQQRVARISAGLQYGDLGSAVEKISDIIDTIPLAEDIRISITGQNEEMQVSFSSLKLALLLAIFMVYLVMASQFESFIYPFVILVTVPLALIGAIISIFITNSIINVVVLIGLIILTGIVVNNGIVLIDFVNRLRQEGMAIEQAVIEAGKKRLRPILMTTLTTVLGLFPLALGFGEGAEIRTPMAITVIGGLLAATFLTLFVIPVVYMLLDRFSLSHQSNSGHTSD